MPEPTLNLTRDQLAAKIGLFAGWGRGLSIDGVATGDNAWTAYQQQQIEDAIQSGLRRFYYPSSAGTGIMHNWSFLKPVASLDFPIGASVIPLPDDYGACEGPVTIALAATQSQPWVMEWRNEAFIRQLYATTSTFSGPPQFVAEQVLKGTTPRLSGTKQLYVYPQADQRYTLQVTYYVNPEVLTEANPYAYGGAQHAETILESCLAVFEERVDDTMTVHAKAFADRLLASIAMDNRNQPQSLGPNLDWSDRPRMWGPNHYAAGAATYNGQSFS